MTKRKNGEFAIERGRPIPRRKSKSGYPWDEMQPGDSFFVPGRTSGQIAGAITHVRRTRGWKIVCRSERDGVRIWRVE